MTNHFRFTNFETVGGNRISVPTTANVTKKKETRIPSEALEGIKGNGDSN